MTRPRLLLLFLLVCPPAHAQVADHVPDEFVVVLRPEARAKARAGAAVLRDVVGGGRVASLRPEFPGALPEPAGARRPDLTGHYLVKLPPGRDLDAALAEFAAHPDVIHVERIGIHPVQATPDDIFYGAQWHYWDTAGIDADLAWDEESGNPFVVVGVLDTGVRYYHEDLGGTDPPGPADNSTNGNVWVSPGEIPGNGLDDDANGYTDDAVGWDFVTDPGGGCTDPDCTGTDNDPRDGDGHGTHVSGTVAAITNNEKGVAGVAGGFSDGTPSGAGNGCKVMCLRIGWHTLNGAFVRMDWAAQAMVYVAGQVDRGVNVAAVNCSWGSSNSGGIDAAVNALLSRDVMVIAAAGNSASSTPSYLGAKAGVMNVAATASNGTPASFTNYGPWVDLAAPGVNVYSTHHNLSSPGVDSYASYSGTSMAAPHACGVAALLESKQPALTRSQKFSLMVDNVRSYAGGTYIGSGILNAKMALDAVTNTCAVDANFSAAPLTGCVPHVVSFVNQSSGPYTSSLWDFGDGATSTVKHPSHEYQAPGAYSVTLTVFTAGCSNSQTLYDYVVLPDTVDADFAADTTSGPEPLAVQFTDLSSSNTTSWQWDFGDGATSTAQNPVHTYAQAGVYTVTLIAGNDCWGDLLTRTDYITVTSPLAVAPSPGGRLSLRALENPARGAASLAVEAPEGAEPTVRVLDVRGRLVRELRGGRLAGDAAVVRWDGRDGAGARVPAGLYVAVLAAGGRSVSGKLVLLP